MIGPNRGLLRALDRHLPGRAVRSIVPLGSGADNTAWLVDDDIVVRQAIEPNPDAIRREVALLETVARYATLPVPEVDFVDPDQGILAYRILPGRPALDIPDAHDAIDAHELGSFLAAIHAIPLAGVEALVPRDVDPLQDWLDEAAESYERIVEHLPVPVGERVVAFLEEPPPPEPETLTFCHNDFGAEHILVDPATMKITGIIDWSDAAITDPVRDLSLILRDLGPDALDRALAAYGALLAPADHARLVFHARCKLIEDLAYGIEAGETRYIDAALGHIDWTFG